MSIEASAWAWAQKIPLKPKFALVKLADQTDERTGRVCYGKTDLDYLAEKCAMPRRSLTRCIAALIANNYMIRESGKGKGTSSQYWLCLGREPASSIDEFSWASDGDAQEQEQEQEPDEESEEQPQAVDEGGPNWPTPPTAPEQENGPPGGPTNGLPGGPIRGPQESTKEPKNDSARESERGGFSKELQNLDRAERAKEIEKAKPAQYFVIEGSDPWKYWLAEMRRRNGKHWNLTCDRVMDGRVRRGWYFPSLYPPKPKAPPGEADLSAEDIQALSG